MYSRVATISQKCISSIKILSLQNVGWGEGGGVRREWLTLFFHKQKNTNDRLAPHDEFILLDEFICPEFATWSTCRRFTPLALLVCTQFYFSFCLSQVDSPNVHFSEYACLVCRGDRLSSRQLLIVSSRATRKNIAVKEGDQFTATMPPQAQLHVIRMHFCGLQKDGLIGRWWLKGKQTLWSVAKALHSLHWPRWPNREVKYALLMNTDKFLLDPERKYNENEQKEKKKSRSEWTHEYLRSEDTLLAAI